MEQAEQKVFLHPGDIHFGSAGTHVHTLLGSCIAITLWHPQRKLGGMCHFVLPARPQPTNNASPDGRYADEAIELFKRSALAHGTQLKDYQAKIFGGGDMSQLRGGNGDDTVGERNAEAAFNLLMQEGVLIMVADVGETGARRVVYDISNGDVWVRHQLINGKQPSSINGVM